MKQRFALVGSPINRSVSISSDGAKDQRFVNCFPEITRNPVTGKGTLFLVKRIGTSATNCAGASYLGAPGAVVWTGFSTGAKGAFCYLNSTTLQVWDTARAQIGGNPTAHTTGFTSWTRLSETVLTGTANLVLLAKESASGRPYGWYYPEGGAWTEITDGDFPPNQGTPLTMVGNAVHMDGYMFVMCSNGQIWNSDLNSVSAWTSTSFTTAQVYPDGGVGLARIKNTILAFGTQSVEFFQNTGNATGSPLTRIPSATIKIGAVTSAQGNAEVIKTINDEVFFIGSAADSGNIGVYKISGFQATKISNAAIDKYLQFTQINGVTMGIAGAMVMNGMTHLVLATQETQGIPCYCLETGVWWYLEIAGNGTANNTLVTACLGLTGESYFNTVNNGSSQGRKLFVTTHSTNAYGDDDATAYTMSVQTLADDYGSDNLKECIAFRLISDTQSVAGNATVSYSDNDGVSFSTAKNIDMTQKQKKLDAGLGWFRTRSWKISESVLRQFRASAYEVEWDVSEE